jgi:hypothetical protein
MKTLSLVFVSVAFVSVILLTVILLVATATAQDKDDLKSLRAGNSLPFYMGVITGMTSAYIASHLAICPRPVNRAMVVAVSIAVTARTTIAHQLSLSLTRSRISVAK